MRGTQASGKTNLLTSLDSYIKRHDPTAGINIYRTWSRFPLEFLDSAFNRRASAGERRFRCDDIYNPSNKEGCDTPRKLWILIDDAMYSYGDYGLWSMLDDRPDNLRVVCFTSCDCQHGYPVQKLPTLAPEIPIRSSAHMDLLPSPNHGVYHSLCWSRAEYDHYISLLVEAYESGVCFYVPPDVDLADHIFSVTAGHPGAIMAFLQLANIEKVSYPQSNRSGERCLLFSTRDHDFRLSNSIHTIIP